jgi:catechol 2,3-dioxygenase-like lactoylglutathione lyase family enzyme
MPTSLDTLHPEPVSPAKFAHYVIRTDDLELSRAWYLTVLSATITFENEMCSFMTYDDEHHRVGIIQMPGLTKSDATAAGVEHVAFTYGELSELLATYLRLKKEDIIPYWPVIHGPTVSIYYRDPSGVKVELQYDVFKTKTDVDAFFASGQYDENFVGITFDPDEMVERFNSGVPVSELIKRPQLPAGMTPWDMVPA